MGNLIRSVDEFFWVFIEDGMGRFILLHLPFWGLSGIITWNVIEYLGLYILFAFIVFAALPFIAANIVFGVYLSEFWYRDYRDRLRFLQVAAAFDVLATLILVGIPGVYFGILMEAIKSKAFTEAYWAIVVYWWKFFNFYHDYKMKDAQEFVNGFSFNYQSCQITFFVSGVVITPFLFYWLFTKAKAKELANEREERRLADEAKAAEEKLKAEETRIAERQRINAERLKREEEARLEKQRKLQEKTHQVTGKDPWESGFL